MKNIMERLYPAEVDVIRRMFANGNEMDRLNAILWQIVEAELDKEEN